MMLAELRALYSTDVPSGDLTRYVPEDATSFGFPVTAAIGPKDAPGVEIFDFFVCTPRWLAANLPILGYEWGRHKLILERWDYAAVHAAVQTLCAAAEGSEWATVAARLARYGAYEFEDDELPPFRPPVDAAMAMSRR